MKKIIISLVLIGLTTILFAGCSGLFASSASSSAPNTVHMTDSTFGVSSITITKGSKLTLVSDTDQAHIIANGSWGSDGLPHPKVEAGAPVLNNVEFLDNTPKSFGPFNTPGVYHLYCTIHTGMNLTVTVK